MLSLGKILAAPLVFVLLGGSLMMANAQYRAVTLVDRDNPVPAEWLQKAGIDYVYTGAALSMEMGPDGKPHVPNSHRGGWEKMEAEYNDAGIKVLIMGQYYTHNPDGTGAVDVSGRDIQMACLNQDKFYEWMSAVIIAQAKAYSEFQVFGGFMFDDGAQTRVDCCYCDTCKALFSQRYGKEPPPFEVHEGTGVVADDDVLLEWEEFQREAFERYLQAQAEAVRSVSDDLLMVTIPSDSFYYGRLLNANLSREDLRRDSGALIQRIERTQVKDWYLYQAFPFPRLPEAGEKGLQFWGVGCHISANSPKLVLCTEGPFLQHTSRMQMMSPAEIEQMTKVTVTEGANAICYWQSGSYTAYYPEGYDGMAAAYSDILKIEQILEARTPHAAEVGLLYSTTTEVMEQPWRTNLNERWVHLHSFEGTAFALMRGNVPYRIVMEDQLADADLGSLTALVLPNVRFLSAGAQSTIEQAAATGMKVYAAGECVTVAGAETVDYDVTYWHRRIQAGYRQIRYLNTQYAEAEKDLLPLLRRDTDPPVSVSSRMGISRLYDVGDEMVLMIANWDLHRPTEATLRSPMNYTAVDTLSGEELGDFGGADELTLRVPAADWRIIRLR